VEEAVDMLDRAEGRGRVLAGGTDLVEKLRKGNPDIEVFVDVGRIAGFGSITFTQNAIVLHGGVTHAQVATSDRVREHATVLAEACLSVGGPQIRNLGTLAGNIVSAQPAADGSLALTALGAVLTVVGSGYVRTVDMTDAFAGVGLSTIDDTKEIITEIAIPLSSRRSGSSYQRLAIRGSLSLPMVAAAAVVSLENGNFDRVRVAVGPMAEVPLLVGAIDDLLRDKPASQENIGRASETVVNAAQPRDSRLRGSREYRLSMVRVLAVKAMTAAVQRAQGRC
jgi:carbon-monoxide dehydrogenase medium subunit